MTIAFSLLLALQQPATPPQPTTPPPVRRAAPAPATATIDIRVTSQSGIAAPGAHVRAVGPSFRDGTADGNGMISFKTMTPGTYRLRAEADNFLTLEKEITVRGGATRVDFALSAAPPAPAPPPPPEREAPPPPPPPPPPPAGERGEPRVLSIPDLAEDSLGGRDPVKITPIGCTGMSTARLIVLREAIQPTIHDDIDETLYLVAGEATLTLGGKEQPLIPGWFSVVPRGTKVGVGRRGRNPAILLSVVYGRPCEKASISQP